MDKTQRRFDFIDPKKWDRLSKKDREVLNSYRGTYGNLVKTENKIKKLQDQITDLKSKVTKYHTDLSDKNHHIDHLRDTFYFGISFVKIGGKYWNISIGRRGRSPKSGSLGTEDMIIDHLLKFYKRKKSNINPYKLKTDHIKDDWKSFLKLDQDVSDRILDMILEDPNKFRGRTINRNTLFPLSKKSTK